MGDDRGHVKGIRTVRVDWDRPTGDAPFTEILGSEEIWECDLVLLSMGFVGPEHSISDDLQLKYDDQSNYKGVSEFKRILNYFIKEELVSELIDEISNYLNFKDYSPSFYVSERNLKKMSENDMIIGSHTVNHRLMSKLSKSEQEKEISDSFAYLQAVCNITHKTYCHPYGGFHSFNEDTLNALEKNEVLYSFNVEQKDIFYTDIEHNAQFLPRYDCNYFKYGQSS